MKKRQAILSLLIFGALTIGGGTVLAAEPAAAAKTAETAAHVESKVLEVAPEKTMVEYIPDVVYEQVPSRGYQNVAMQMDVMQPQKKEKMPAIWTVPRSSDRKIKTLS